jgi:hypothetical protein
MKIANLQRAVQISQDLFFLNAQIEILKKVNPKKVWSMRTGEQSVIVPKDNKLQFASNIQENYNLQIEILNNELTKL